MPPGIASIQANFVHVNWFCSSAHASNYVIDVIILYSKQHNIHWAEQDAICGGSCCTSSPRLKSLFPSWFFYQDSFWIQLPVRIERAWHVGPQSHELNKRAHAARWQRVFSSLRKMRLSDQISHIELSNYRSGAPIVSPAWKRIVTNSAPRPGAKFATPLSKRPSAAVSVLKLIPAWCC